MNNLIPTLKVAVLNSESGKQHLQRIASFFPEVGLQANYVSGSSALAADCNEDSSCFYTLTSKLIMEECDMMICAFNQLPYPLPENLELITLFDDDIDASIVGGDYAYAQIQKHFALALVSLKKNNEIGDYFKRGNRLLRYGQVTLVGFGPGDPDLLTIGGYKALQAADVIFHDDLVDSSFLNQFSGKKIYVGKRKNKHSKNQSEICDLLLDAAMKGKQVVRLKGGDPMIFAHGGEEVEHLQRHLIQVKAIPGISTANAAASLSKVALTHRNISSSVAYVSGHSTELKLPNTDTVVIYMGGTHISTIAAKAIADGRKGSTPVMLVHNVSYQEQKEYFTTLEDLANSDNAYPTPIIIIVGEVVNLRFKSADGIVNDRAGNGELEGKRIPLPVVQNALDRIALQPRRRVAR